ncbi:hypothetical protein CMV_016946 [Castanea mollissima]|uniref:Uncharacterized protein n=1 Tax=Castanea mollissima TaxID=60419 RepID=A0A8J4VIY3_9ROSI|nr:hypothetical protein CMV_016946 [Castanea mollissima]
MKVWEESPYGEWLRATEDVPPQTSDSLVAGNPNDNGHGIDGAETEPLQNFNSGNGHSYHSTTIIEEGNLEIVEVVERTELKGPEINAIDMLGKSSSGSVLKWLEQILDCFNPKLLLSRGYGWLCDAYRLLQTNLTFFKRLMISLASGKAVWDAIFRKESARKFQWTPFSEPDLETRILMLILDTAKDKVRELIEEFLSLVNELFQPSKLLESP